MPTIVTRQENGTWWGYKSVYSGEDAKVLDLLFCDVVKAMQENRNDPYYFKEDLIRGDL